jgi:hypothetical protein
MKMNSEKERNSIVDKLIHFLEKIGKRNASMTIEEYLDDEGAANRHQTEAEYQKEQEEWLRRVKEKKISKEK